MPAQNEIESLTFFWEISAAHEKPKLRRLYRNNPQFKTERTMKRNNERKSRKRECTSERK